MASTKARAYYESLGLGSSVHRAPVYKKLGLWVFVAIPELTD